MGSLQLAERQDRSSGWLLVSLCGRHAGHIVSAAKLPSASWVVWVVWPAANTDGTVITRDEPPGFVTVSQSRGPEEAPAMQPPSRSIPFRTPMRRRSLLIAERLDKRLRASDISSRHCHTAETSVKTPSDKVLPRAVYCYPRHNTAALRHGCAVPARRDSLMLCHRQPRPI